MTKSCSVCGLEEISLFWSGTDSDIVVCSYACATVQNRRPILFIIAFSVIGLVLSITLQPDFLLLFGPLLVFGVLSFVVATRKKARTSSTPS